MRGAVLATTGIILTAIPATAKPSGGKNGNWPDLIPLGVVGFEPEGIERGRGHDFFVGGFTYSSAFLGAPDPSVHAGSIYKGNLRTGEVSILVAPTGEGIAGLSYDARTDYLYTVNNLRATPTCEGSAVLVYDATTGDLIEEICVGFPHRLNDILVTAQGVFITDTAKPTLLEIPLGAGGRLPALPTVVEIEMSPAPGMDPLPPGANGLVGRFSGRHLVVGNGDTGVLYRVDMDSGEAIPIDVVGEEQFFGGADGLYLDGHTLYICRNFPNKIAVVQLSGDLTEGTFVKNIESPDLHVPTTIIGFGNCIYAINTRFFEIAEAIQNDPPLAVQTLVEVVKLRKFTSF